MDHPNHETLAVLVAARHAPQSSQAFDRLSLLTDCLRSVIDSAAWDQQHSACKWKEIQTILIDDNSPMALASLLPPDVLDKITILTNRRTPGQSGALNTALSSVSANVFAFTDSDCVVGQDWLSCLGDHYARFPEQVGVAGPNWYFVKSHSRWKRFLTRQEAALAHFIFGSYVEPATMTAARIDCRNLSLRADFLTRFYADGFFQEGNGPSVSGQASANLRQILARNRLALGFEPKIKTYHKAVDGLRYQIRAYYKWGRQGDYHLIYSAEYGSLVRAFFARYLLRHFVYPSLKGGAFWPYVALVHGAYWTGIIQKSRLSRAA